MKDNNAIGALTKQLKENAKWLSDLPVELAIEMLRPLEYYYDSEEIEKYRDETVKKYRREFSDKPNENISMYSILFGNGLRNSFREPLYMACPKQFIGERLNSVNNDSYINNKDNIDPLSNFIDSSTTRTSQIMSRFRDIMPDISKCRCIYDKDGNEYILSENGNLMHPVLSRQELYKLIYGDKGSL